MSTVPPLSLWHKMAWAIQHKWYWITDVNASAESQSTMRSCTIKDFKDQRWSPEGNQGLEDRGVALCRCQAGYKGTCPRWLFCKGHEVWLLCWGDWGCFEVTEHHFGILLWDVPGTSSKYSFVSFLKFCENAAELLSTFVEAISKALIGTSSVLLGNMGEDQRKWFSTCCLILAHTLCAKAVYVCG